MIVFPHVPKTGGTSLYKSLRHKFGKRMLQTGFGNAPDLSSTLRREVVALGTLLRKRYLLKSYDINYGHFPADLYRHLQAPVGMFFREPRARVISEFHYHQRCGRDISLRDLVSRQANFYSLYLGRLSIEDLAFVGITERYQESLTLFERVFGIHLDEFKERVGSYDTGLMNEAGGQQENQAIYHAALRRFEELCKIYC